MASAASDAGVNLGRCGVTVLHADGHSGSGRPTSERDGRTRFVPNHPARLETLTLLARIAALVLLSLVAVVLCAALVLLALLPAIQVMSGVVTLLF